MANETEAKQLDGMMDEFLDQQEKETPSDASAEIKPEGEETKTAETETAEVSKTEQVKEVEADASLSVEDKIAKIKEILGDDEKAIDAYIKSKGYHKDPAWQKQREIIDRLKMESKSKATLSDEDKRALEDFKTVTSSAEYIQASMKAKGYTQEAIEQELRNKGFKIPEKPADDISLICDKLNIKPDELNDNQKAMLEDIAKVTNILFQDRLNKILPEQLKPIQEHLGNVEQVNTADKIVKTMRDVVKNEGILDFDKDVEPKLNEFLDKSPDATQADVFEHFKELNHRLSVERLRGGKRQEERDVKKENLRQNLPVGRGASTVPEKTGNFDKDADAFLDSVNYRE